MSQATTTVLTEEATAAGRATRVPWYLWCAAMAVTSATIGGYWDVSWHRSIGRDTFWTAPHIAIQFCGILAATCCGYLILAHTFGFDKGMSSGSVRVWGFRAPLGAFLASWGGAAMLTSVPFDNWWHAAYGLDVKIVSPPHAVLMMGTWAVSAGVMLLIASATNQANAAAQDGVLFGKLQRLMLYVGGVMMALQTFFLSEYTWDTHLHSALAYKAASLGVPLMSAMVWNASRHRWASTWMASIYMAFVIGMILVLPLFPAQPKLGPVYQAVTHFIPPKFPVLLIVPAVALDLLWSRVRGWKPWRQALVSGPLYVAALVAVEYPFANFLMSKASENRFFGTMYHDYATPSWAYDVQRRFMDPQHGLVLFKGLAEAAVIAGLSAWLGIKLGQWMSRVRR